tara:strand:+ start:1042 stop:1551 length:510 start_codon:yes stop_codon:yes gene_type:complete
MKLILKKYKILSSTNDKAISLIKNDNIKPTLILSEKQKNGRGRYGKKWISFAGNLFMTIFFKIKKNIDISKFNKKNCIIIKRSLSTVLKGIKIKFPNDLLIKKRKFCGILQETIIHKNEKYLIIGIGININKSPIIIDYPTCYLNEFSNKKVDKFYICSLIKKGFEKKY